MMPAGCHRALRVLFTQNQASLLLMVPLEQAQLVTRFDNHELFYPASQAHSMLHITPDWVVSYCKVRLAMRLTMRVQPSRLVGGAAAFILVPTDRRLTRAGVVCRLTMACCMPAAKKRTHPPSRCWRVWRHSHQQPDDRPPGCCCWALCCQQQQRDHHCRHSTGRQP